ncbi:hypothetical protein MNV49_004839 [Pseudohyphozyma bogoriensis]|nr:hypothetical protein MNV49_004839 [Pseudohyphozyma bogoriensis]
MSTPPFALTIAGSDSGAGAGIQADLKTFSALDVFGTSVITALTAQNSKGVLPGGVEVISADMVVKQLDAVLADIPPVAIKMGMLGSEDIIHALAASLSSQSSCPPIVLDPVCVSTSGSTLLPDSAINSLSTFLIPLATIITPNTAEAKLLADWGDRELASLEDARACAGKLAKLGARWVLLKGGHMPFETNEGKKVVDLLYDGEEEKEYLFERPFINSPNTHGTGCSLSSAIASYLAHGKSVPDAVRLAGDYVAGAIFASYPVGEGAGPINHFFNKISRTIALPTSSSPTPFTDYLINYDPHYARTNSLAAYKSEDMKEMAASTVIVDAVLKETEMHVAFCEKFGISRDQLLAVPESISNVAYNRYVLDTSMKGDLLDCRVVTAPCLIGYGQVGARLVKATDGVDKSGGNPYWSWIAEYGGDWYQGAVKTGIDLLESTLAASPVSPQRLEELAKIFRQATLLEVAFWDAAVAAAASKASEQS